MTPNKTRDFLVRAIMARENVLIVGPPGIGKSDVIDQAAQAAGAIHILQHCVTHEPIDARGLPTPAGNVAKWLPFEDLEALIHPKGLTLCDLEDLGQSIPQVQAAWMQIVLRGAIGQFQIDRQQVVFCASTNSRACDGVGGIIEPLKSRFTIVEMEPNADDLRAWGEQNGMPLWLQAFWASAPNKIADDSKPNVREIVARPSPRGWARVGRWDAMGVRDVEVWQGCVGQAAALEAMAFCELADQAPSRADILANPGSYPVPSNASLRYFVATMLAAKIDASSFGPGLEFCSRMGKPWEVLYILDADRQHKGIVRSTAEFKAWACQKENFAIVSGVTP